VDNSLNWQRCLLPQSASVQGAIECLDRSALQIVLVVDDDGRLLGTVTDGDIRRGLLRGLDLASSIQTIVHSDPLVVPPLFGADAVLQLMKTNKINQLPVVDDERRVTGLHVWSLLQATQARSNLMVIMAGGKGVRLRPHTESCPKPMLPIGGKPMLEHIIDHARNDGFQHFVVAIHYLGHMIEEYFGNGQRWGVSIEYLREEAPLGTGGALSLLSSQPTLPIIVSNGDVLTDVRYGEILDFHQRHAAAATMAVRSHEWQHPFGVVKVKGVDIVGLEEKPIYRSYINAGIYAIEPRALALLETGKTCDMPTLFERLQAASERTIVYPMHEPWLDVGRPDDLDQARSSYAAA
jgi:dTDP-glucose pyrophosphorylase